MRLRSVTVAWNVLRKKYDRYQNVATKYSN